MAETTQETKRIGKLYLDMDGEMHVLDGTSSQPGPDTVGTEQIIDGAVEMEDLNESVKDTMLTDEDRVTEEELGEFDV